MNIENGLATRKDLQVIIKAYEKFLTGQVVRSPNRVRAIEALSTRDIMRTMAMAEVSKTRADRVIRPTTEQSSTALIAETPPTVDVTEVAEPVSRDRSSLFKDFEDCIPCNENWLPEDFDWSRLKAILLADLKSRYGFLLDLEDIFKGNQFLDQLCQILQLFKNLCPKDLIVLIGILMAYIGRVLDSISFNLASGVGDILGTLLRPYISGLEDFLSMYLQFIIDQIDCILNEIKTNALMLKGLSISNTRGPKAIQFEQPLTTQSMDDVLQGIADKTDEAREAIRASQATDAYSDVASFIEEISKDVISWVEDNLNKVQDAIIDLLGGEWLLTRNNISWLEQVRAIATLIDIMEVIVKLGTQKELCTEDNIRSIVTQLNDRLPGGDVILVDASDDSNSRPTPSRSGATQNTKSLTGSSSGKTFKFSIADCMKAPSPDQQAQMLQWMGELMREAR